MTLVEALRYHASLMIAPEVAPKVRALLNDASTVMWAAAEALSTESETKPSMDISFCPGCEKEWNRATPSAEVPLCAGHADMWFTGRNHLKGDTSCVVCAFRSSESACTPLGWVTITDKRVSDPVYRTREAAEQDAELLRARGIETRVAGVYLAPPSATEASDEEQKRAEQASYRIGYLDGVSGKTPQVPLLGASLGPGGVK